MELSSKGSEEQASRRKEPQNIEIHECPEVELWRISEGSAVEAMRVGSRPLG